MELHILYPVHMNPRGNPVKKIISAKDIQSFGYTFNVKDKVDIYWMIGKNGIYYRLTEVSYKKLQDRMRH